MSRRLSAQRGQNIPEDACCEEHREPLRLFCEDDQALLCGRCFRPEEHENHVVNGVREAADRYRVSFRRARGEPPAAPSARPRQGEPPAGPGVPGCHRKLFQGILNTLKKKLEVAKSILADEQERMVMIQGEEQDFKEMIESEYRIRFRLMVEEEMNVQSQQGCIFNPSMREDNQNQLMEFATELKEKSQETLQRLNDLGKENMNKLKESEVRLSEQICSLQRITAELEKKCGEYTLALLQERVTTASVSGACPNHRPEFMPSDRNEWNAQSSPKFFQPLLICSFDLPNIKSLLATISRHLCHTLVIFKELSLWILIQLIPVWSYLRIGEVYVSGMSSRMCLTAPGGSSSRPPCWGWRASLQGGTTGRWMWKRQPGGCWGYLKTLAVDTVTYPPLPEIKSYS
ncbi:probable E3 ubiquitin-protein ligase TRIML2 isoform X3 [Canis lupus baileyi]|uniref:probable E3 ubiquitin-protein ligase TRIML2 isoform X3 n=1 Tax=Canis lupus baileyi TaxID=143281 RepID=UPI003B976988